MTIADNIIAIAKTGGSLKILPLATGVSIAGSWGEGALARRNAIYVNAAEFSDEALNHSIAFLLQWREEDKPKVAASQ
jgi:hypothetical protein